jgi:zinc/manganese transport system substrate-binding protein
LRICLWSAVLLLVAVAGLAPSPAANGRITVVAAENFYGDVAAQIGGDRVSAISILNSPDQDPHLFETSPSVVREIAKAQMVIYNGVDYDAWMEKILKVTPRPGRIVINVADLLHKKAGDNPHLWYDPATMPALAKTLAGSLSTVDAAHADDFSNRLKNFLSSLQPVNDKIAEIRGKHAGVPVTATEPVFGYMAAALHLTMRNQRFQLSVMNDTEPSATDLAAFESDLKTHKVKVLFYNTQASDNLVQRLVQFARTAKVPVVGVTETCPTNLSYQDWMRRELDETERALSGPAS